MTTPLTDSGYRYFQSIVPMVHKSTPWSQTILCKGRGFIAVGHPYMNISRQAVNDNEKRE